MWLIGFLILIVALMILSSNYEKERKKERAFMKDLKSKTETLRQENDYFSVAQGFYMEHVKNAKRYESDKNYEKAIEQYKIGLDFAENEPALQIHNFARSIQRLIILYGKTKQFDDLKNILEQSISKYPNYRNVDDWKMRLEKLNAKPNN